MDSKLIVNIKNVWSFCTVLKNKRHKQLQKENISKLNKPYLIVMENELILRNKAKKRKKFLKKYVRFQYYVKTESFLLSQT